MVIDIERPVKRRLYFIFYLAFGRPENLVEKSNPQFDNLDYRFSNIRRNSDLLNVSTNSGAA